MLIKKIFLIILIIFNITNCAEQNIDQEYCNDQFEPGQIIIIKNSADMPIEIFFYGDNLTPLYHHYYGVNFNTESVIELWKIHTRRHMKIRAFAIIPYFNHIICANIHVGAKYEICKDRSGDYSLIKS